jgi:hypothetical protein
VEQLIDELIPRRDAISAGDEEDAFRTQWQQEREMEAFNEKDTHFSKLFTDDDYYQAAKEKNYALAEALDPEATAKRSLVNAYLEHRLGREIPSVNYEPERDAFAMQAFGQKNLNDGQLFDYIRGDYDWQKQRTEAINDLQMQSVGKAIADSQLGQTRPFVDGMTEVFNQWQQKYPELVDGKNDAAFLSQGYKLYYDTINDLDTVRPQASKALSTLTSFTQGNATDEDMQSLANDFVGAPPEDRQKIYKYVTLAAQAGQIDRAGIEQFAINMGQAFTRGFDFVPQGTLQMQEAGVNNWLESIRNGTQIWVPVDGDLTKAVVGNAPAGAESDAWRQATVPEAETLIQSGHNVRESFKVVRELRNVAKTGVDPIRPVLEEKSFWGTAERGAYGLSGSIPLMGATAVNPYLGVLAYQATEYDRIMLENPEINPQFAQGLALVEGAANAAIDRVQLSSLSGRLPMFGRYLDRIASNGVRRTVKIGANVVEQNLQEGAQDLIAPVLETAVAALREDMPDKDFGKLLNEWGGQRAETFFATLPLALIGGGVATYRDIKNPSAELNATKLRMAGFGKDQVTFIQRAENPEEYDARIQMEWEKRTSENIKAGEQEVLNTIEKARTPGELDARIERVTAPDGSEDIVVTSPDGRELLRTKSEQAALEAVRQHNEAQLINERNAVSDMVDYFRAQDPTNEATIEAPRTVQQELDRLTEAGDSKGIANLNERIRFAGIPEGSDLTTYNILGEANVETTAEGVFRGVIKLRENSRPEDAFEEINHVFVRKALAEGRTDLDSLRGWLNQTSEATGETYATDTETDIIENIAKVGMDYAAGRIEETSLPASFVDYIKRMLQVFKETMARAIKLKDAFATGKIDSNFESFLAESVGLNQQTMVDTTRERVGGELAQGTFNYSVGQRVSTDTNPYPMEQKGKWWANEDFAQRGGQIVTMSPDEFLSQVRPLEVDEASRDNIDDLKNMMQSGRKLDPLAIYADGKEDGRHRATAAKELGMDTIPVLDFRANKPEPKGNDFSIGSRASAVSTDTPSIRASNATITGPANYSIGAFHGTPHKVDKFSTDKIGTGEGAQAYGWGLYFAQAKAVGEGYRDQLGGIRLMTADGQMADNIVSTPGAKKILKEARVFWKQTKSLDGFVKQLESSKSQSKVWAAQGDNVESNSQYVKDVDEVLSVIKDTTPTPTGNLYTVDLDVEPGDLLDWDKPLSEQSPKVNAALQSVSDNWLWQDAISGKGGEQVGGALYSTLRATFPDAEFSRDGVDASKKASEALLAAGIPGIRYLDGGSRSDGQGTYNYVAFDENLIKITEENGNRIPASQALAQPVSADTNYSIGMTVAPLRRDSLSELNKKEMQKRASSAKFIHLQQVIDDVANAYGVKIESRQPVIGGWVESGQISLEVPEAILFDTDDLEMAQEMAAIVGASAPELQNAVMLWKDDDAGKDTVLEFQAKGADSALAVAKDLNAAGLNGFTYDTKSRKFSLVLAGVSPESIPKVYDFIDHHTKQGSISSRGGTQARSGVAAFPSESDYRGYLQGARSRANLLQQGQREALLDVVGRAERRVDRYAAALKISEQAKKIQKKLKRPSTSALAIETELKGKQFDNIRQLGLYLDARFNKVFGKPSFEIGGQEGIDIASDAFVYDIIDGLAGDGSGMGWYDERVQETIRELSKLHPEFATDSNALAVYIGILATTSQGYTVVENFKQANKVYNEYKRTGRIPTNFKFAKSSDPINSNLAQIQGLIDEHGLDGYAEFMDQEVTGQALRDQFGKTPTGVTLKDTVRGNRVLGPKIGSFFNNLRGQFDTITMDLWYTRTMHRFLGETVVPLDSDKMQKAITKFREELKKDGVRTYGIDLTEALKDDEATVQAALTLFQRWARGDNDYTEKGYFKFPDGYKIEKAARGIFSIGGMKGAPQNKTHRQYFAKVVLEAKAKLAKLGMKLTEADMQAIIWYREKNLFARTGVANAAAKPADYLDAVMVARSGAQVQEDVDPADLEAEDGDTNYSIASQSEIDRVNRALGGMNRGPDERLKVYERARAKFGQLLESNKEAIDAIKSAKETDTAPALEQVETERASNLADLTAEENAEVAKALQDNADTFMPRIEAAATPAERKRVERDAKDRAKILEQGIRNKFDERKTAIDTKAKSQSQQIKDSAANRDSASRARMTEKVRRTKLLQSIGELDAVLSVLPPEIRGKVGGFAVLANIGTGDKALSDFFVKRIEMIDRQLERTLRKEYDAAFRKLLDRTKPKKAAPGEKPKGIGADIQDLFTVVRSAVDMDAVSVAAHIAGLDAKIASGELTAEQEARAQVEAALVSLVGDWRNADADRRRSALTEATRIWSGAYAAHTQKVIQLREQREVARMGAIQDTGKSGELAGRKSKAIADSGLKGSWKDYILNLLNFDQVAGILFGENSETANTLIDRQRTTENAKEDGQQAKMQALEGFFTDLAGGNLLAGEQLRYNLAQPSMEVQGIKLSELEGLSAAMMWEQEDGRRHMTGELDETGKPSGSWHYDQDFVDDIIANLSPEALQLRDWLLKQYADEYGNINAVYSELNGVNLPQIRNYSPVTVQPVSAPTGQVLDPVSGSAMSGASTSPGALRTRGTAIAEPRFADVLQTYISHTLQMEHWKSFAPFIAEVNGVLRNRDVQNSVEEKGGAEARKILNAWLDYFAQGGTRDAGAHLALNQGISNVLGRASQVALIGRVSTLLVQSTQLGAALAEMPLKAYLKRMGKLLTGQLGWDASINSPYIQRRIAQMPPVVQMAMQGLKGAKPTAIQQAGKRLGNLLSGADGLFTAGTYAITYDYHLTKAQELGLTGAEAESYARNIAERVTDRIAQPTRPGARSLYENTSTNPLARAGWAFASEARKNLALVAYSFAERDTATKMRTLAYVVAINSIASSILRSIWRDMLDDDDEELFDDKYWSPKRIAIAAATEPLYGFPVLGSTAQNAIYRAFGEYQPGGTMFDVDRAINPVRRIPEYLEGDFEMRDVIRDIDMIVSAMGLAHPNIAAAASITHLAKDLFNIGDSAVDAVTED